MEIFATCIECMQTKGKPLFKPFNAPYFDGRVSIVTCEFGHEMAIVLKAQKFELLLESGANALIANFTLEASASFSASLERFFEFCIRVMLNHLRVSDELFDSMFSEMSRQSERQTGAFLALYALVFGVSYKPNRKLTEFRNSVIHKGTIPDVEKAHSFCESVYKEIFCISELLREFCSNAVDEVLNNDFECRVNKVPAGVRVHSAQTNSIFSISFDKNKTTFAESLENYKEFKAKLVEMSDVFQKMLAELGKQEGFTTILDSIRPK
ncbi:hypothetical protein SAMN04488483_0149 [Pseudomonas helmanticensis]|uniref:Uncharacterized protein n=1 Tax=Pseudomonas helmanticensis TaxID=1471381 RepID=A0ACD2TZA8_9PSED|nr:hypothetical protein [Pseudomonas helmanticensis]SMQ22196.1 hypothetical protein SAMN04488483_0149 [Pseudomonas helmanticensis]